MFLYFALLLGFVFVALLVRSLWPGRRRATRARRFTNRGWPYSPDELDFIDENGEIAKCDYQLAAELLDRRLARGILPKHLIELLVDYRRDPCVETALDLILFDPALLAAFYENEQATTKPPGCSTAC